MMEIRGVALLAEQPPNSEPEWCHPVLPSKPRRAFLDAWDCLAEASVEKRINSHLQRDKVRSGTVRMNGSCSSPQL